jgi:hypothetical protein
VLLKETSERSRIPAAKRVVHALDDGGAIFRLRLDVLPGDAQLAKPYSRARTNCASASVMCCLSGSSERTRAWDSGSPAVNDRSSSFAWCFCCSRFGRAGSERRNGDDTCASFVMAGVRTIGPKRAYVRPFTRGWAQPFPRTGGDPFAGLKARQGTARRQAMAPARASSIRLARSARFLPARARGRAPRASEPPIRRAQWDRR